MAEEKKVASKYAIVNSVMALLNLGDNGRLDSFISREVKKLQRQIDGLKRNLETKKFKFEGKLQDLKDAIADAKADVTSAFEAIDPDILGSNAAQDEYAEIYWRNIDEAEKALKDLEEQLEELEEDNSDKIKEETEKIKIRESRIKRLTKG